jgi:two-component system KDP operon response regulator KdpE
MENKFIVLIVEDEKGISNFISAILTSNDYHIIKCQKGSEAVSMTTSYLPDVILLDLGLPDMDGLEVSEAIRMCRDSTKTLSLVSGSPR